MVGHSGSGPEAESLVPWGKPPRSPQEQLAIVKQIAAHAPRGAMLAMASEPQAILPQRRPHAPSDGPCHQGRAA